MNINHKHEIIANFNFISLNIRIYIKPNSSNTDQDGIVNTMRQIDIALQPYTQATSINPDSIPDMVDALAMIKAISKIEIINPINLNGFCIYPNT